MSTVAPQADSSPRKRRRYRFIWSLGGFVASLAIIGACDAALRMHNSMGQREAVEAIEKLGGSADYSYNSCWLPWNPIFGEVYRVNLDGIEVTDAVVPHLAKLTHLIQLSVINTQITDPGLERLGELTQLQYLTIAGNDITDAGLVCLKRLTQLKELTVACDHSTDAGLAHVERLTQLRQLLLLNTRVTDAGMDHLKGLSDLKSICLWDTQVTDEGVRKLQRALPRCKIDRR